MNSRATAAALEVAKAEQDYRRCLAVDDEARWGAEGAGLWYLMTQFLESYGVTEELGGAGLYAPFHRPMLREWDEIDARRAAGEQVDTIDIWPRDHLKTWCLRARAIRRYMRRPSLTQTWWHAVEEMSQESAVAIGKQLQENKKLRQLCKGGALALPHHAAKRFVTASGFRLPANRVGDAPSLRAAGAGTEVTGGHSDVGTMDDIVGWNDVVDNQMQSKLRWYRATVRNVVRSNGVVEAIGTRWDPNDPYATWLEAGWNARVRACLETEGKLDYKGEPVFLTRAQIERKRSELGETMFALQMMNDPSPASELAWQVADEALWVSMRDSSDMFGAGGPGVTFVLSDPAPAVIGSPRGEGEKARGDGSKDDWATAVIKIRNIRGERVAILLDLSTSTEWDLDAGFDECARLMARWQTNKCIPEFASFDWTPEARKAARRNGVPLYLDERGRLPRFISNYAHGAKNVRFGVLASWANNGKFFVCRETVPEAELEKFLYQAKNWKALPNGKNNLKHDDAADVVSRCTDPLLAQWNAPEVAPSDPRWHPLQTERLEEEERPRSRYCAI